MTVPAGNALTASTLHRRSCWYYARRDVKRPQRTPQFFSEVEMYLVGCRLLSGCKRGWRRNRSLRLHRLGGEIKKNYMDYGFGIRQVLIKHLLLPIPALRSPARPCSRVPVFHRAAWLHRISSGVISLRAAPISFSPLCL